MSQLPPADPSTPSAGAAETVAAEPGLEVKLHAFWDKNRNFILLVCAAILLAIVGREGWQYFAAARERDTQDAYAKIADQPDKLATFADAHAGHALAGVAYLQVADQKFAAADYKSAAGLYQKAVGSLKNDVLLGRARLGLAMSQLSGGDQATATVTLRGISADQALLKAVRAEAQYHLATLAVEAGRADEAKQLIEEINKTDAMGSWSQRATMLLTKLPATAKPADASTPTVSFKQP
jgi:predicted negative regulator of RcsB-dependent stress response